MNSDILTLLELNALARKSLEQCLPDSYWIQAELSEVRVNQNSGHCYLELVQKDAMTNYLVAKARGIIWANVFGLLRPFFEETTGQQLVAGIKVLIQVSIHFHELYGYSLVVENINPEYTLGDLALRRKEILDQLKKEGVLTLNKELNFPLLPQRIAVISSATAAGYDDFHNQLKHNERGYGFLLELFPALMQGDQVEKSILSALDKILKRQEEFDVVIIIRGGGSSSDLSGFDTYLLAAACAQFPLPIITGIGHERDDTVLDSVAYKRVKTPTAAAEFLIYHMDLAAERLGSLSNRLWEATNALLTEKKNDLLLYQQRIPRLANALLANNKIELAGLNSRLHQSVLHYLSVQKHKLSLLTQSIKYASPEFVMKRGYTLTTVDGKIVKSIKELSEKRIITTHFKDGKIKSEIKEEIQ
ncbi:MAG: exodeoxyribonuclease VII large subunit [Bacteroidales bacterium]|nr:exodeoxyribonuclease VII large subunit [Bacteroidales bacterium]